MRFCLDATLVVAAQILLGTLCPLALPAQDKATIEKLNASRAPILRAAARIDELVQADWQAHDVKPSLPANDQIFMRRVYLDITGTIPTGQQALDFLNSKFGRSPKINERSGRDHHPAVFSSLLAGGGIKGGYVHGASDERGHYVEDSEVTVEDFNATIARALGIPLDKEVYSASKRPFTVANGGQAVDEVFA